MGEQGFQVPPADPEKSKLLPETFAKQVVRLICRVFQRACVIFLGFDGLFCPGSCGFATARGMVLS